MAEEAHKTKDRSPNFPFISLEAAINRAQQFYAKEKRGSAPFAVAAEHWGYSATSSGAFQTAAALKSYGLMSDEAPGLKRTLRLTELALRILLDQRPDSMERGEYMLQASLSPAVAADIRAKWPDDLPSKPTLHHYLVLERGFGDQKAHSVVGIIYANHELTGSTKVSSEAKPDKIDTEVTKESTLEPKQEMNATALPRQPALSASPSSSVGVERLKFRGAEILISFDGEPNYATFDFIERYMKLRKELLKEDLVTAPPKEEEDLL